MTSIERCGPRMYPNYNSPYPPAPPYVAAPPPPPVGNRRSVGVAVLLETLIAGAGFMYAGSVGTGIFVFVLSLVGLVAVYLVIGALSQATGGSAVSGNSTAIFATSPATLNIVYGIAAVVVVYCALRYIGAARAVFARNNRVVGSSRPLAGLAAVISVLSAIAVTLGLGLYFYYQQSCVVGLFSGCASPVYLYQSQGEVLLIGGAVGLMIGLIG